MEDLKKIQEFFSKPLEEGKQLDIVDFAKVVQAVTKTGHPVTVLLVPKFNEIEVLTGMNAPDDMLFDLSNAVDSLGYGRNDIIIAADSSNLSRREYSDIRRVNGGHKDYFEESLNENEDPIIVKYFKRGDNHFQILVKYERPVGFTTALGSRTALGSEIDQNEAAAQERVKTIVNKLKADFDLDNVEVSKGQVAGRYYIDAFSDSFREMDVNDLNEYNTGIYYDPAKERNAIKAKEASKTGLEKVKDMIKKIMKEDLADFEEKDADYNELYSDYLYKMVKEVAAQKGFSKYLKSKDNPKGETDGLDTKTMNKILMNVIKDLDETIQLGKNLEEGKLCPKGEAYRKRRMAAGEKSSAYLSGRAVKVCKGQMSGKKKK